MNKKEKGILLNYMFMNHINHDKKTAIKYNTQILLLMNSLGLINNEIFNAARAAIKKNDYYTWNKILAPALGIEIVD